MTDYPKITIIIPTYRRPNLLKRAIYSVLKQTYPHLQVCIYDNASGDETARIVADIAKTDPRVRYHCHSDNIGGINNFAFGIKQVNTPFFSFLSDDDILLPDFLEVALKGFNSFPDAMFSAASSIIMNDTGEVLNVSLNSWSRDGYFSPPESMFNMVGGKQLVCWTSVLFRQEVITEVGGLDIDVGWALDYDFMLRIAIRFPIVISKEPCAIFIYHQSSYSAKADFDHFWPGWKKLSQNICADERLPLDIRNHAADLLSGHFKMVLLYTAIQSMSQGNCEDVVRISEVLRQYLKLNFIALIVLGMAKLGKIPGFCKLIALAEHLRRKWNMAGKKSSQLNRDYGHFAQWLRTK